MTYHGIAAAFNEPLYINNDLKTYRELHFGKNEFNMSTIPKSSKLIWAENEGFDSKRPIINVHNVFIFPGISSEMKGAF